MTDKEKTRAYDEALKRAKEIKSKILSSHLSTESCKVVSEYIDTIIPELAESEDERIRKDIVGLVSIRANDCDKERMLAWLEKLKDASKAIEAVDKIDKYIDTHTANAHNMKDSNHEKDYYSGWDDALGKMAGILQDVYSDEKQKSNIAKLREISTPADEDWFEIEKKWEAEDSEHGKEQKPIFRVGDTIIAKDGTGIPQEAFHIERIEDGFYWDKEGGSILISNQDEFQLIEWRPVEYIEFDNEFKNQVSHLLASVLNKEWEYNKGFVEYTAQQLLGYAKHEIKRAEWSEEDIKKIRSEEYTKGFNDAAFGGKIKEWSEEDEGMLNWIIATLCEESHGGRETNERMVIWLEKLRNSLRPQPHWKPSEEQMNALEHFIRSWGESGTMSPQNPTLCAAKSLLNDLEKL